MFHLIGDLSEAIRSSFPWINFVIPVVVAGFAPYVAFEQATNRRMRVLSILAFLAVLGFEVVELDNRLSRDERERKEEQARQEAALEEREARLEQAETMSRILSELLKSTSQDEPLGEKERTVLVSFFGDRTETVIERIRMQKFSREAHLDLMASCKEAAHSVATAALQDPLLGTATAICDAALEKARTAEAQLAKSAGAAATRIETAARDVTKSWTNEVDLLKGNVTELNSSVLGARASIGDLETSIKEVDSEIELLKNDLMEGAAEASAGNQGAGMLVRLEENLVTVDEVVDRLTDFETKNREYRQCLARNIWPWTLKCASILKPEKEEQIVEKTRAEDQDTQVIAAQPADLLVPVSQVEPTLQ